jgi:long-subunit fatty acid transport protein
MRPRLVRSIGLALSLLVLLWGSLGPSSQAQTALDALFFSERLPGTGTRLSALGGASLAGVSDYGALYSNPAGLGYFETSEVAGTFHTLVVNDEASYSTTFQQEIGGPFSRTTTSSDQVRTGYGIGNAALIYKVPTQRGSFVLGFGTNLSRAFDRSVDVENRNQLSSVSDILPPLNDEVSVQRFAPGEAPDDLFFGQQIVATDSAEYLIDFDDDGDGSIQRPLSYVAFQAFGINFYPSAYDSTAGPASGFLPVVPAGIQFRQTGDLSESGTLREWNFGGAWEAEKNLMLGLSANIVSGSYELRDTFEEIDDNDEAIGFNELRFTRRQTSDLTGFNLRGGLSFQGSSFRVGVSVETPTWYSVTDKTSIQMQTVFDNGDRFAYGDDSDENVGRTEFDYTINTPWRLGAGASLDVADATLLVDALFVDWTQLKLSASDDRGTFDDENQLIDDHFRPVVHARVGVEYDFDPLTLRAGFAYQPSPVSLPDVSPEAGPPSLDLQGTDTVTERTRYYPSLGLGYQASEQLHVDLSWVQERFEDRFLPYVAPNASYVNEDVVRNRVQVGLRYTF